MKAILPLVFALITINAASQQYNFTPNWKKGEVKTVTRITTERDYEDDTLISDSTSIAQAKVSILDESKKGYTVEFQMENAVLSSLMELNETLGADVEAYQELKLIYSVDKKTGKSELQNWEEARDFMNESFDLTTALIEENFPDEAAFLGLAFLPLKTVFKSKENTDAYMQLNIGYILLPFQHEFELGKQISMTDSDANPFNPMQELSATTHLTLESVDEKEETCVIKQEIELDLSEFILMIQELAKEMAKAFGVEDSLATSKTDEMSEFEMDIENIQTLTFNYATSWVTNVEARVSVIGTEPGTNVKSTKETTVSISVE